MRLSEEFTCSLIQKARHSHKSCNQKSAQCGSDSNEETSIDTLAGDSRQVSSVIV